MATGRAEIRCPATRHPVALVEISQAEHLTGPLRARTGSPFGRTDLVLLRADNALAYPVVDGIPIMLRPEALTSGPQAWDLGNRRWAEAYREMDFYNDEAARGIDTVSTDAVDNLLAISRTADFPSADWIDAPYDAAAQLDAYRHLGRVDGKRVAQLGGKGMHAIKMLLAGAREAWLITPMYEEALFGRALAARAEVGDRFHAVVAIAEDLPFGDEVFDAMYCGGCLHHMSTDLAAPQVWRVLTRSGRFAAVEPWRTAFHRLGTRIVGKREANPHCRPLDAARVAAMSATFDTLRVTHHGPVLRYLALGLQKFVRRPISTRTGRRLTYLDDLLPLPAGLGGSVAVLATRS